MLFLATFVEKSLLLAHLVCTEMLTTGSYFCTSVNTRMYCVYSKETKRRCRSVVESVKGAQGKEKKMPAWLEEESVFFPVKTRPPSWYAKYVSTPSSKKYVAQQTATRILVSSKGRKYEYPPPPPPIIQAM